MRVQIYAEALHSALRNALWHELATGEKDIFLNLQFTCCNSPECCSMLVKCEAGMGIECKAPIVLLSDAYPCQLIPTFPCGSEVLQLSVTW